MDEHKINPMAGQAHLQEHLLEVLDDRSLPAEQVLKEQGNDEERPPTPAFIP